MLLDKSPIRSRHKQLASKAGNHSRQSGSRTPTREIRWSNYSVGLRSKTFDEVAQILSEVVGQPFYAQAHAPEEFLENAFASGADPAYMNSVYTQFQLNTAGRIINADATFENFEAITGRKPTTWREFAQKQRHELKY